MYTVPVHNNFVAGSVQRPKTIEPAVQLVFNGWTNEQLNRRSHRFVTGLVLITMDENTCLEWNEIFFEIEYNSFN